MNREGLKAITVWIPEGLWAATLLRKGRTRESLQAQVVEGLRRVTGWEGREGAAVGETDGAARPAELDGSGAERSPRVGEGGDCANPVSAVGRDEGDF